MLKVIEIVFSNVIKDKNQRWNDRGLELKFHSHNVSQENIQTSFGDKSMQNDMDHYSSRLDLKKKHLKN